tara:strand:- start:1057 stop:1692 length:636 start_codon:yes stop_codon:yes gene_type:complete
MSNWGRSPRGGNGLETAQALNEWRETCDQEKYVRTLAAEKLGYKLPPVRMPPPGVMRSQPPTHLSYLFASPRSTQQMAAAMAPRPAPMNLAKLTAEIGEPISKTYNRKKETWDFDQHRGDHQIFPEDPRSADRKKIQKLKAQVALEKKARREMERKLMWQHEFEGAAAAAPGNASPRTITTLADPRALAAMQSPRGNDVFSWISGAGSPRY